MIDIEEVTDALVSEAQRLGVFDKVNLHEPKAPPSNNLTCSVWAQSIGPLATMSGLQVTTAYLVMSVRIYMNMLAEDQDRIDPKMLGATQDLLDAFTGNFTLDGIDGLTVDLLGIGGETVSAQAGYVQIGGPGGTMSRIMTITVPMIITDAWAQEA